MSDMNPRGVAYGQWTLGILVGGYAFFNVLRYLMFKQIQPLLFPNSPPMPFSSSCAFLMVGLYMIWTGMWTRYQQTPTTRRKKVQPMSFSMSLANIPIPVTLAILGSITTILTTLIAAFRK